MALKIGDAVVVRRNQGRLGGDKCPGRIGVIIDENPLGRPSQGIGWKRRDRGGLWTVRLNPRGKSGEREESFWGDELEAT